MAIVISGGERDMHVDPANKDMITNNLLRENNPWHNFTYIAIILHRNVFQSQHFYISSNIDCSPVLMTGRLIANALTQKLWILHISDHNPISNPANPAARHTQS